MGGFHSESSGGADSPPSLGGETRMSWEVRLKDCTDLEVRQGLQFLLLRVRLREDVRRAGGQEGEDGGDSGATAGGPHRASQRGQGLVQEVCGL